MKRVVLILTWNLFLSIPLYLSLAFKQPDGLPKHLPPGNDSLADSLIIKDCGKSRTDIKMLVDTGIKHIDFTPRRKEVNELAKLPKPTVKISSTLPRLPAECVTYQVNCRILEYKKEDDGDYHLIIQDISDTTTIVAEIVDPRCEVARKSNYFKQFLFVRRAFEACTLSNGKVKKGIYKIIGVAFYDKLHGAEGASANGIELHPLIYFSKFK